jgi:hypothetical protein
MEQGALPAGVLAEAREALAACEEASEARRATGATPPPEEPHPFDALWPGESQRRAGLFDAGGAAFRNSLQPSPDGW